MRHLLLPIFLTVFLTYFSSDVLSAESPASSPCSLDSGAVFIDTNMISIEHSSTVSMFGGSSGGGNNWQVQESTWKTSSGRITHILDPTTFTATGSGGGVDLLTFAQIIDILALEAVRTGVDSGYGGCGDTVSVLTSTCVARSGSGSSTVFTPCGPDCCERTYLITCPDSLTIIPVPLSEASATCTPASGGCESGCDGAGGGGTLSMLEPQPTERSR